MKQIDKILNNALYDLCTDGANNVSANIVDKKINDYIDQVKKLIIHDVSVSFEDGYKKGYKESTSEACKEIAKNYTPNER